MECRTQRALCHAEKAQECQEALQEATWSQMRRQEVQDCEGDAQEAEQAQWERQEQQQEPILAPPLPQA